MVRERSGAAILPDGEPDKGKENGIAKDYAGLAKTILEQVGGDTNVSHFEHCSTRLRFTIVDPAKVNRDALKATAGVMGVVGNGAQCQVVIGNDVVEVYDEINKIADFGQAGDAPAPADGKKDIGSMVLDFMVGVFQPLVPAIAGGGILKAFLSLFVMLGWMNAEGVWYNVLLNVADAPLYFLPLMVAVTMATKIGCNKLVALACIGALILPKTTALIGGEEPAMLLGFAIQNVNYAYQVFPAILATGLLYFVEESHHGVCR